MITEERNKEIDKRIAKNKEIAIQTSIDIFSIVKHLAESSLVELIHEMKDLADDSYTNHETQLFKELQSSLIEIKKHLYPKSNPYIIKE
jgi:hypothetical protein